MSAAALVAAVTSISAEIVTDLILSPHLRLRFPNRLTGAPRGQPINCTATNTAFLRNVARLIQHGRLIRSNPWGDAQQANYNSMNEAADRQERRRRR